MYEMPLVKRMEIWKPWMNRANRNYLGAHYRLCPNGDWSCFSGNCEIYPRYSYARTVGLESASHIGNLATVANLMRQYNQRGYFAEMVYYPFEGFRS